MENYFHIVKGQLAYSTKSVAKLYEAYGFQSPIFLHFTLLENTQFYPLLNPVG